MADDYGIKVSEPGYDVKSADDINLSLKSDLEMLKVFASGSVNLDGDQEIEHNLGYTPQYLVFVYDGSKTYMATGHISYAMASADTTKLYIEDNGDVSAKYYIFYEQIWVIME